MATYSTNYKLDKYAGTDKPNLRDQYNSAIDKIDAQMKTNANAAATAATAASNASAKADSVEAELAQSISDTADSITTGYKNAIATETTRAKAAEKDLNDIATDHETLIKNNTSAIAGKAPIMHSSQVDTYGLAAQNLYGHCKVTEQIAADYVGQDAVAASAGAVYNYFGDMFTFDAPTYVAASSKSSGAEGGIYFTQNKLKTLFKLYGFVRFNLNSTWNLDAIAGKSGQYGIKVTNNAPFKSLASSGAFSILSGGERIVLPTSGSAQLQYSYASEIVIGSDGNVYVTIGSSESGTIYNTVMATFPAAIYVAANFGDAPVAYQ